MSATRISLLFVVGLALCRAHAVVPIVPAAHSYHSLVVPYPLIHQGYGEHGPFDHGLLPLGHHLIKRSPYYAEHVAPLAPVAVSHQASVDLHSSPVVAPVPFVKTLVAPVIPVPVLGKTVVASPLHYGAGLHGGFYPYSGHY